MQVDEVPFHHKEMPKGTIVEVVIEDDDCKERIAHGVIERFEDGAHVVCYIEKDDDGVYALETDEYVVPVEAVNDYEVIGEAGKRAAWQRMGFVYRSRNEILPTDEVNSEESDEEWVEGKSDNDDDDDDDDDEDEEDEEEDVEDEDDIDSDDDVICSTDEEDDGMHD